MNAIGWDDEPESYFNELVRYLANHGIVMKLMETEQALINELAVNPHRWDLIITDLVNKKTADGSEDAEVGQRIANFAASDKPVYVVTQAYHLKWDSITLPSTAQIKPKRTPPAYVAAEIRRDLEQRGLFVDRSTVAVIYGHDTDAQRDMETFLTDSLPRGCGLDVRRLDAVSFTGNPLGDLRSILNEAGAVIALCTPDDWVLRQEEGTDDSHAQPRQNILFEIGMVLGTPNGSNRLITVQKWGEKDKEQARLPRNLGGWLNLTYSKNIASTFPRIREKLAKLGVQEKA